MSGPCRLAAFRADRPGFDILVLDGDDLRSLPLTMRKTNLDWLLARRPDGIFVAPFKQGEIARWASRMVVDPWVLSKSNFGAQSRR